jgi:hypothetical protein
MVLLWVAAGTAPVFAQSVQADPVQCWWRTSAGAVRVGEVFSVVLTCAVQDGAAAKAVLDEGPLSPTAVQLPPFEVMSGTHYADLRADGRRFFQYDYRVRVINEDLFGKDVALPELKLSYRVQTHVNGTTVEGIEKNYLLPALSVRVLSLVPANATDIRDSTSSTFGDIEDRVFKADLQITAGGVLLGFAGLAVLIALVSAAVRLRADRSSGRGRDVMSDLDVLRSVDAELTRIDREHHAGGWTPALASRLLTALRVVASFALSSPSFGGRELRSERQGARTAQGQGLMDGQLVVRGGWMRGKRAIVTAAATPLDLSREMATAAAAPIAAAAVLRRSMLEDLHRVLARLTAVHYGRGSGLADVLDAGLDEALEVGHRVIKRLKAERGWSVRTVKAATRATVDFRQRVWSR